MAKTNYTPEEMEEALAMAAPYDNSDHYQEWDRTARIARALLQRDVEALAAEGEVERLRLRNQELVAALEEIARWSQDLQDRGAHLEQWRGCVAIARAALERSNTPSPAPEHS